VKKAGMFFLVGLTLVFIGFIGGMLTGRMISREPVTVRIPQTSPAPTKAPSQSETQPTQPEGKININTAYAELLDTLPGIGPVLAQRIVEYREKNGPFQDVSQLSNVEGIGNEKLVAIYDLVTVED